MTTAYQVRVHIIEAREIKGKDADGNSDPLVSVEVGTAKQYTQQFESTTAAIFDRLLFFDLNATKEDMESTGINITMWDANTISSSVLIGKYDMDCGYVYSKKHHELYRQWAPLLNSEEFGSDVQGYIKVTASVLGPGETPPTHQDEDDDEGDDPSSMVLSAPDLKQVGHHLFVRVYKAESLPKMDILNTADGFVRVKFASNPAQETKVIWNSLNPVWNTEIRLPVMVPVMANSINIEVLDKGRVGKALNDRVIGKSSKKFSEVLLNDMPPTWFNLYGHPYHVSATDQFMSSINGILEAANPIGDLPDNVEKSAYAGRVLVAMETEKADKPKLGTKTISSAQEPKTDMYLFWLEILEGNEMAVNEYLFETCVIEFVCGGKVLQSKPANPANGQCQWYQSMEEIRIALPIDVENIYDVFINVYKRTPVIGHLTRIGYKRIKLQDLDGFNERPGWHVLSPDPEKKLDVGGIPGYLQYSLCFGRERDKPSKGRKKIRKPPLTPYVLRAHIFQARNLQAADEVASDPYVVVRFGGSSAQTLVIKETLFPQYYTTLTLDVEVATPIDLSPNINVMVYDSDTFTGDDLIGRYELATKKANKAAMPRTPKWRPLRPQGDILISFQLINKSDIASYPMPDIRPETRECIFEISAIGVRDMQPYFMLGVDAPSLEFDPGDAGEDQTKIKSTKPGTSNNANFLQTIPLPMEIPINPIFAQTLTIKCHDNRTFTKPLVGTTSVSVAKYIPWPVEPEEASSSSDDDDDDEDEDSDGIFIPPDTDLWNHDMHEEVIFATASAEGNKGKRGAGVEESEIDGDDDDAAEESKGNERPKVDDELEDTFKNLPFEEFILERGNAQGGLFGGVVTAGTMKAKFRIVDLARRNGMEAPVNLKVKYAIKQYFVRIYVLRGMDVAPKDSSGLSDPYLIMKIGDGKGPGHYHDFVDNRQEETLNPDLFVACEMKVKLPGIANLYVELWDYDLAMTHDLIGSTKIDLETRIFNDEWKDYKLKPLEYRTLTHPASKDTPMGKLEMWVDIVTPEEALTNPMIVLERPQPAQFTLRVVIWNCRDVKNDEEATTDLFVSGQLSGVEDAMNQTTDTHWRSDNDENKPEFNWRFIFPLELYTNMEKNPRLQLTLWDADLVGSNDSMGDAILSLKPLYKKAMKKNESAKMENMWLKCTHPNFEGVRGQMRIELEVLPTADHELHPVGKGRDPPNENPFLPTPDRPSWITLPSFDLFGGLKKKAMMCCGCVAVVLVLYVALGL